MNDFLQGLNTLLNQKSKEYILSLYFDTRIDLDLKEQYLDCPPEAEYASELVKNNIEKFKHEIQELNYELYLDMQNINDPYYILSLWINYTNETLSQS